MNLIIKICGICSMRDATLSLAAGATHLGFILAPQSPRCMQPEEVRRITAALPDGCTCVGVFVNTPADRVAELMTFCGLGLAQLHGEESAATARQLGSDRVWKMFSLRSEDDLRIAADYPAAAIVADTATGGRRGGTGVVGDWTLAQALARQVPVILAGGLRPDNVADAVARVRPAGVDVSSGVEAEPRVKSTEKVRAFLRHARQAGAELQDAAESR